MRSKTRAIRTLAAISLVACLPSVAPAQNGPIPQYIESMQTFEIRRLDGQYAPTNGNVSMRSVTPSAWLNNDPAVLGLSGVLAAWSGGAKSTSGTRMFVHGGGHSDSANNGMYIYDYSGDAAPTGWLSPLVISDLSAVRGNQATYGDGNPTSVHTYDGVVHASHNNHIYRFGGSQYSNGFFTRTAFKYNISTGQWARLPDYPGFQSAAKTIYDPVTGKIFVTMTDVDTGYFLRTDSDTWSGSKSFAGNGFPFDSMAAWDTRRNRGILVGEGERSLISIDFDAETVAVETFNAAGDTNMFSRRGVSAVYDPVRDVYWMFAGPRSSAGWTTIYEMNASGPPWTVTPHAMSGDSISRTGDLVGSWGRFVLMPQWNAIGLVADESSAAFVIKLSETAATTPNAPANMDAN